MGYHYTLRDHGRLETTALIILTLTYPDWRPDNSLEARFDEVCSVVVRRRCRDQAWANEQQLVRPRHVVVSDKRVATAMRQIQNALPKCLDAGWMALPFVRDLIVGPGAPPSENLRKLTANAMATAVAHKTGATPENVKTRIWRRSGPVIHFCVAYAALHIGGTVARSPNELIDFLAESDANLLLFLRTAEMLEEAVIAEPRLPVTEQNIFRIRLTDS